MSLSLGRTVIHPHHGPVTVIGHVTRKLRGKSVDYAELQVIANEMTIAIPVKTADEIGLRDVANKTQMNRLYKTLCAETTDVDGTWARRMKAYSGKLITGEPLQIAEVVRDLIRRREERGISLAERELLRDGLGPLVAEMALAADVSEERAEEAITEMVTTGKRVAFEPVAA